MESSSTYINIKAYINFANKYRPQVFSEVIGQNILVKILTSAITEEKVANVFLFSGPYGTGKTTIARILASSLNCLEGIRAKPCLQCSSCRGVKNGSQPDVIEIDAASHTSVENIRIVIENSAYLPTLSRSKIYIIDEVHMLSNSAFNALLKTLEEPKNHVKFIFATTELHKVPATITSRCQHFHLSRPSINNIVEHLQKIANLENIEVSAEALELIAESSLSSVRDALTILEQAALLGNRKISREIVRKSLGCVAEKDGELLALYILNNNTEAALNLFKELYYMGHDPVFILQDVLESFHKNMRGVLSVPPVNAVIDIDHNNDNQLYNNCNNYYNNSDDGNGNSNNSNIINNINSKGRNSNLELLSRLSKGLITGIQEIKNSLNPFVVAEILLIRLCLLTNLPSPKELIEILKSKDFYKKKFEPEITELEKSLLAKGHSSCYTETISAEYNCSYTNDNSNSTSSNTDDNIINNNISNNSRMLDSNCVNNKINAENANNKLIETILKEFEGSKLV